MTFLLFTGVISFLQTVHVFTNCSPGVPRSPSPNSVCFTTCVLFLQFFISATGCWTTPLCFLCTRVRFPASLSGIFHKPFSFVLPSVSSSRLNSWRTFGTALFL
ncbi:hypothetical protein GDO78_016530 [Eleutherodactylus coqui]|uniref:Secreted protein n=1 Tax=Eleutherodactylus coqui TaxID=57060 RepID=A0A8J6JZ33_ELECQ|nr:hypothetical protein GDO78_016530 [Eleutherodactylus coqui]